MAKVYLSLGSNIDREQNLKAALDALYSHFGPLELSRVFESEAIGFSGDSFYNMVVGIDSELSIAKLSKRLKQIEDENGRDRTGPRFSSRTLDIDILTYDSLAGDFDGVSLPRAEIYDNAFVLWPLSEVAGDVVDPIKNKSYESLWGDYSEDQTLHPVEFEWQASVLS